MPRPGVLLVAVALSAPQPATIRGRRTVSTRAPTCRYALPERMGDIALEEGDMRWRRIAPFQC
jgi:hypothetical protein